MEVSILFTSLRKDSLLFLGPRNIADFIMVYYFVCFVSCWPAAPHQSRSFGRDNGVIVDGIYPENALLLRTPGMGQLTVYL